MISRVLNSSRKVKIDEFRQYVFEAYYHRITIFKFWEMNDSVHRIWGHCIHQIQELGGYSCGLISETPLESMVNDFFYISYQNLLYIHSNLDIANKFIRPYSDQTICHYIE